jgi:hypothetical protein
MAISCEADRVTPTDVKQNVEYKDLQNKDDVLYNLELAYNERDTDEFEKLLDVGFAFVFSRDDYRGGQTPQHWGDASEIDANRKILDPNLAGDRRVISVDLSLDPPVGGWTPEAPNLNHPGETWYVMTVGYDLVTKTADDWEHRALGEQAQLKIRWVDTTGRWAIVVWSDDPGGGITRSPAGSTVEETSWGIIKAQYCSRPYEDLSSKDDVLYNLEFSYNRRDFTQFENLLDSNFVFIFSEADFYVGEVPFPQWDRDHEIDANQRLLDPNLPGGNRAISISLRLDFPVGNWIEQSTNPDHPDESWYFKSVDYDLVTKTADGWEHRALNLRAQLTVRWDELSGRWQIVLWRDDVYGFLALSPGGTAVEEVTWGAIKAQYYVRPKDEG